MNRRGQILAILSLAATAGVPVLFLLVRWDVFTFTDDFYGFNAAGFFFTWTLVLLTIGTLLGGLACHANRRSWLAWSAFGVNGLLLVGLLGLIVIWRLLM